MVQTYVCRGDDDPDCSTYVDYTDYAALEARCQRAERRVTELEKEIRQLERDAREDIRDATAEARHREQTGDPYGVY
jgi:hypothetical protein